MKIELGKLNDQKIKSTGGKNIKMGFASAANAMLFDMFTDGIYANPIGSIVREITSNSFDSHIEAGKENPSNPVIVAHTYDKAAKEHYISFFDKGMGMSPERIENIYGMYFESTKRESNDEIGGFGLGGKSPMAYKRTINVDVKQDDGTIVKEERVDSSFFVITRYNGIEYSYNIFKGAESPEINLLFEQSTKEVNGTEIRIPVQERDLSRFESEIERQLYYFENIVFQGFTSDAIFNNYKIYKGKNFLYRGNVYGDEVHLCIGKVAYPIKYPDLGLDRYSYRVPVALKFEIGEIDVTPNREDVRYTQNTITKIKEKIELVRKELGEMIGRQYDNVQNLEDYYRAKENFGELQFKDQQSLHIGKWITKSDINFINFKYNDLPNIPTSDLIIKMFYNVHEYGKRNGYGINVPFGEGNNNFHKVWQSKGEFERKIIKQSYLGHIHDKNFAILKPYMNEIFDNPKRYEALQLAFGLSKDINAGQWGATKNIVEVVPKAKGDTLLKAFQKDVMNWVSKNVQSYDDLEVPEDFIEARKKERLSNEILNTTIPLGDVSRWNNKSRISIKSIVEFKGRVFYGLSDEESLVKEGYALYNSLFGDKHVDHLNGYQNKFKEGKGILFITVAKGNEKYIKMCPNTYRIEILYPLILRRKIINQKDIKIANDFMNKWENVQDIYTNETVGVINKVLGDYSNDVKAEFQELIPYKGYQQFNMNSLLITKYYKPNVEKATLVLKTERKLNYIVEVMTKNKDMMQWIDIPYGIIHCDLSTEKYNGLVCLLKKVMVF